MKNAIKFLFAILIITFVSCKTESQQEKRKKYAEVLFEIHKADAILNTLALNDRSLKNDSLSYYNYVFKKMDISKEEYLEMIDYLVDNPKEYDYVYKIVMQKVNDFNQESNKAKEEFKAPENDIWNQKRNYSLPLDGGQNAISFEVIAEKPGIYTLEADYTIFHDCKSVNPRITIIAVYTDNSIEQNETTGLLKDDKKTHYSVKIKTNEGKKLDKIRGWVYDHSSGTNEKHANIENISLTYTVDKN